MKDIPEWKSIKPFFISGTITNPEQKRHNLVLEKHDADIIDICSLDHKPSLDAEGFEWIDGELRESLETPESIDRHIRTLENLVLQKLGAESVYSFDQLVRASPFSGLQILLAMYITLKVGYVHTITNLLYLQASQKGFWTRRASPATTKHICPHW